MTGTVGWYLRQQGSGTEGDYNPAGGMGEGEGGECKGKLAILQVSLVKLTKEKGTSWISVH